MDPMNFSEQFDKYGKATAESLKSLGAINARVFDKLTGAQRDFLGQMVELSTAMVSNTTEVRDLKDLVARQTQLIGDCNEKLLGMTRTAAEILLASREEYQHWFEDGLKSAGVAAPAAFTMPNVFGARKAA